MEVCADPRRGQILQELIALSRWLGEETRGYAILGEGNTSARLDGETLLVKASGAQLGTISAEGFVQVLFEPVLKMLDGPELSDAEIKSKLIEATVDNSAGVAPSIETLFHAYLLSLPGVEFVGHTHPVTVNAITCSQGWRGMVAGRLFPDEVVCCGVAPAMVDYVDPGVPLGKTIREAVRGHVAEYGGQPKSILMQNHGLIALGQSAAEVKSVTAMWDKAARVLAGTYQFGGPCFMSAESVERIATRPDEIERKRRIEADGFAWD